MAVEQHMRLARPATMPHHHRVARRFAQGGLEAHRLQIRDEELARAPHLGLVGGVRGDRGNREPVLQPCERFALAGFKARQDSRDGHGQLFRFGGQRPIIHSPSFSAIIPMMHAMIASRMRQAIGFSNNGVSTRAP